MMNKDPTVNITVTQVQDPAEANSDDDDDDENDKGGKKTKKGQRRSLGTLARTIRCMHFKTTGNAPKSSCRATELTVSSILMENICH
jgi:hypothetical protein